MGVKLESFSQNTYIYLINVQQTKMHSNQIFLVVKNKRPFNILQEKRPSEFLKEFRKRMDSHWNHWN
jgi:hypothetical protein